MAIGAQICDVRHIFLRHGLWLTAIGIALGIGVAGADPRDVGVAVRRGPADPITYVAVSAALAAVALLATYLPARRAARVDPMVALRADARTGAIGALAKRSRRAPTRFSPLEIANRWQLCAP